MRAYLNHQLNENHLHLIIINKYNAHYSLKQKVIHDNASSNLHNKVF